MIIKSYPLNVEDTDGHYLLFTIFEKAEQVYSYGFRSDANVQSAQFVNSQVKSSSVNKLLTEKQRRLKAAAATDSIYKKRGRTTIKAGTRDARKPDTPVSAISIYTPKSISVAHKANYANSDISGFGTLMQAFTDNQEGIMGGVGGVTRKLFGDAAQFGGTGGTLQAQTGSAVNQSQAEVLFQGLDYRTFNFEFSFMPSNVKEAQTVDDIINLFTYYMLPDRKQNTALSYEIPAEFNLKYMYRGKQNKYIHPALTLVLENVEITYGGEKFATFRGNEFGAQPVKTDVSLTFREIEVADRSTLYKGLEGLSTEEAADIRTKDITGGFGLGDSNTGDDFIDAS